MRQYLPKQLTMLIERHGVHMLKATKKQQPASTQTQYKVTTADLPLCCPMPNMAVWNAHPRVYLPIEETGKEVCPYCGAEYTLVEKK